MDRTGIIRAWNPPDFVEKAVRSNHRGVSLLGIVNLYAEIRELIVRMICGVYLLVR